MGKKKNKTKIVIDYFIRNIEQGSWKLNEKIPSENTLCREIEVSRSSIRAAIQQFVGIGAMKSYHGKGTFLIDNELSKYKLNGDDEKDYDYLDMGILLEFRSVIEPESASLAASRANRENIRNLKLYLKKMRDSVGEPEKFVDYDMMFHREIILAAKNILLQNTFENVVSQKKKIFNDFNDAFGYIDGVYYHTLLLEAIEAGDSKAAKKAMRDHIQKAMDEISEDS